MNAAAFATLSKCHDVCFVGPVNPPIALREKVVSKILRAVNSQGSFFFFSERRLHAIADEVNRRCRADAQLDFFHGFTPWSRIVPTRPYVAWSDCTFRDYIDVFHRRNRFQRSDLERIEEAEAVWLNRATRILFTSHWAAERAVSSYGLDRARVASVGIFGELEMPANDAYIGGKEFAFVSTNFVAKGGPTVVSAFREVRKRHPDASLTIIGDQPPHSELGPGVNFTGYLRKEIPDEYSRFRRTIGRVRALVNATTCDTAPVLLVEAGYAGCPVISSRRFAIPELVDDGHTGLLLEDPARADLVAAAMNWMLEHEDAYRQMRKAAWDKARERHSRKRFEESLTSYVGDALADQARPGTLRFAQS